MFGPYVTSYSLNTKSSQCHYVVRAFGFEAIEVILKPKLAMSMPLRAFGFEAIEVLSTELQAHVAFLKELPIHLLMGWE